jgi:hypothetical protein
VLDTCLPISWPAGSPRGELPCPLVPPVSYFELGLEGFLSFIPSRAESSEGRGAAPFPLQKGRSEPSRPDAAAAYSGAGKQSYGATQSEQVPFQEEYYNPSSVADLARMHKG